MEAPKPAYVNDSQPQGALQMSVVNPQAPANNHQHVHQHKAERVRGGGAGKDCFLGIIECFICFECCKGCCECFADIICCPCEMCC